ncbi:MAG: 50S ribosomal protein L29 [Rikenellaceae bacterium]
MKTSEIQELSVAELIERIATEKELLNKAKMNHAVSAVENTTVLNKQRKDIARMLTILAQKQNQ